MRRHSDSLFFWLLIAGTVLAAILKTLYEDLAKAWVLKKLAEWGLGDTAATFMSGIVEIAPAVIVSACIIIAVYLLVARSFRTPRIACTEIAAVMVGDRYLVRAKLENASNADIEGLKAYLEAIDCADPLGDLFQIDLPVPLYSQQRLKERDEATKAYPARPLSLSREQPKWLELFQINGFHHRIHLTTGTAEFMTADRAEFRFSIYGPIPKTMFYVLWEEGDGGYWSVTLQDERRQFLSKWEYPADE